METKIKSLNLGKLKNKPSIIISSSDALKEVEPIKWSEDVLTGKKKIVVHKGKC